MRFFRKLNFLFCFNRKYGCKYFQNYKETLHLPKTKFPHKVNSSNRTDLDRAIEANGKFKQLYYDQQKQNRHQTFILHDGPPYANGEVHIGHAVNKILKDITNRFRLLSGNNVCYIPGWDCHGLPIELNILKDSSEAHLSPLDIRRKAFTYSQKTKEKQMNSFLKWGILADWKNSYFTCHDKYIIEQLRTFQDLYDKEIVFRDYKPVFWSPQNKTSLAEAELEYHSDHVSQSAFVKFTVNKCPDFIKDKIEKNSSLNIVIWTTTPWSIPANQAVCYSPNEKYCIIHCNSKKENYMVACSKATVFKNILKSEFTVLKEFENCALKDVTYIHPIYKKRECPLLSSSHVTMEKGTGFVHMAPNHGQEDYTCAKIHRLPLDECLVNENGCFNSKAGSYLEGKDVLNSGSACVLQILGNDVLLLENYVHSYPYDWRSKTPVIIRSCYQWFIDVDAIRDKAIDCLETVNIFPDHFKSVFKKQLQSAPSWCISRQRAWGVPIPAFYDGENNEPIVDRCLTEHLCSLIKEKGIHSWWELKNEDLLTETLKKKLLLHNKMYSKGTDIMDIWFDSGISWRCALQEPYVSDVCIEGIDQIRGWFNSSLLTSVALRGIAPFKNLVLHGFTTDAEGRKMSKSEGNVISPDEILCGVKNTIPPYGIDVLRWWVATHACQSENIPVKIKVVDEDAQNIYKIRNTFKFLLGNLYDFDSSSKIIRSHQLRDLDLYFLHNLLQFSDKNSEHYGSFLYKNATKDILNFVKNEVSAYYCHLVKSRLYCESDQSIERLSSQTVLYFILNTLIQSVSPICPHLGNEVLLHHPNKKFANQNVFTCEFPSLRQYLYSVPLPTSILCANQIRDVMLQSEVKTSNQDLQILCGPEVSQYLQALNKNTTGNSGLIEFFQTSNVSVTTLCDPKKTLCQLTGKIQRIASVIDNEFSLHLEETKFQKCPRCRLNASAVENALCKRCANVVNNSDACKSLFILP